MLANPQTAWHDSGKDKCARSLMARAFRMPGRCAVAVLADETTVAEAIEASCRELMAKRARLPETWVYRAERRDLAAEAEALIDQWLDLTGSW